MACVTLKRPVEVLGSPHLMESEPTVKRRCGVSLFPTCTTPPGTSSEHWGYTQSGGDSPGLRSRHSRCATPLSVNRGIKRAKRKLDVLDDEPSDHYSNTPITPLASRSPFSSAKPLDTGKLVAELGQELKRLHRHSKDQPLFTLKQVTIVCQRMLKEREEMLKTEYDKILTSKLAEQYDTFVKFSHDQVEKRLAESAFSYVS